MPTTLSLTWDGGWSHGCPGEGRIRIDDPNPAKARHLLISVSDGGGAHLGELIPSWSIGDAVAVEGPGARIVGLIIGAIIHRGSHYRLPIAVRAVAGSFRDNVGVVLVHATSTDLLTVAAEPMVSAPAVSPQPVIPTVPPSPVASPSLALFSCLFLLPYSLSTSTNKTVYHILVVLSRVWRSSMELIWLIIKQIS
jgi:hypothetical protein